MMILSTRSLYRCHARSNFARYDDTLDTGVIVIYVHSGALRGVLENRRHRLAHAGADLNGESALGRQVTKGLRRDAPIIIETVQTAVQRAARLPTAHFRLKRVDVRTANIGRIGDNEIDWFFRLQRVKKIALNEPDSFGNAVANRID